MELRVRTHYLMNFMSFIHLKNGNDNRATSEKLPDPGGY